MHTCASAHTRIHPYTCICTTHMHATHTDTCAYDQTHTHTNARTTHTCTHANIRIHAHTTHKCHIQTHINTRAHMYTHACVHTHIPFASREHFRAKGKDSTTKTLRLSSLYYLVIKSVEDTLFPTITTTLGDIYVRRP